jgi:hypothetical protein
MKVTGAWNAALVWSGVASGPGAMPGSTGWSGGRS